MAPTTKTLQLRIKDKHAKVLEQMAREVNQVWNHVNEVSAKAARPYDVDSSVSQEESTHLSLSRSVRGGLMAVRP